MNSQVPRNGDDPDGSTSQGDSLPTGSDAEFVAWLLQPWRYYLAVPVIAAILALLASLLVPSRYQASALVFAEQRAAPQGNLGAIVGLASQLGIGVSSSAQAPQFYAQVLGSRRLREDVLRGGVRRSAGADVKLLELLAPKDSGARRLDKGLRRLAEATAVAVNPRTNIIELSVMNEEPDVAVQSVELYLAALERYNVETRRSQAGERRRFAEARLAEAHDSLTVAERAARTFLERNREFRQSPQLVFEYERLERQTENYHQLYVGLRRDFDVARLDEVNDTPVITVIDPPRRPLRRASPSRILATVGGAAIGLLLVLTWASARAVAERTRRDDPAAFAKLRNILSRVP